MNKEYAKNIRFRGEGESNKDAEARINKLKNSARRDNVSFAEKVRQAVDYFYEN